MPSATLSPVTYFKKQGLSGKFAPVPNELFDRQTDLTATQRGIIALLFKSGAYAGQYFWWTQRQLADRTGASKTEVQRALEGLVGLGFLAFKEGPAQKGKRPARAHSITPAFFKALANAPRHESPKKPVGVAAKDTEALRAEVAELRAALAAAKMTPAAPAPAVAPVVEVADVLQDDDDEVDQAQPVTRYTKDDPDRPWEGPYPEFLGGRRTSGFDEESATPQAPAPFVLSDDEVQGVRGHMDLLPEDFVATIDPNVIQDVARKVHAHNSRPKRPASREQVVVLTAQELQDHLGRQQELFPRVCADYAATHSRFCDLGLSIHPKAVEWALQCIQNERAANQDNRPMSLMQRVSAVVGLIAREERRMVHAAQVACPEARA